MIPLQLTPTFFDTISLSVDWPALLLIILLYIGMIHHEEPKEREEHEELHYFIRRQSVLQLLRNKGIKYFFPIQYETYDAINYGNDIVGRDRTGSGKTMAYSLPILERLRDQQLLNQTKANPKFIIILPTRELAIQVTNEIGSLKIHPKQFRILTVYGGSPMHQQLDFIRSGVDIIAATPGRLIDFLSRKSLNLQQLQSVCLDEADEMLKLGFQQDVEQILEFINKDCPRKIQKMLFSATIPRWVLELSNTFMSRSRKTVDLIKNFEIKTSTTIEHLCLCMSKERRALNQALCNLVTIYAGAVGSVIIFCETKKEANELYASLTMKQIKNILHGDISQAMREETFKNFKNGVVKCLIATNVAARGLDIPSVDLIIQLEPPRRVDDYVHRAGRTGRAGKNGVCVTFYSPRESYLMSQIQKMANIRFRHIAEPKSNDVIKARSKDIIDRIRNVDQGVFEYFEDAAKELIAEMGAEKALALAIAEISGVKSKPQECSVQTKAPGFVTFIFSTEGENLCKKQLLEFLSSRIDRFGEQDLYHINIASDKSIVFDVRESMKKKLQGIVVELQKKENFLQSLFRLRLVTNEQMLRNFSKEEVEFTNQQYENAMHNKRNLEVVVKGFGREVEEDLIFRLFRSNNIRIVQIQMLRDQRGSSRGLAFVLCLNAAQRDSALEFNGKLTLQGRVLAIQIPKKR